MDSKTVPVIDIEQLHAPETLHQLDVACRDWGFFQVTNHGLPDALLDALRAAMRRFFSQDPAEKQAILRSRDNPWGYYDRELTKNVQDWKEVYDFGPSDGKLKRPQWPARVDGFEQAIRDYSAANERLAFRLLDALAANLGAPPAELRAGFEPEHSSFLRLNHYPPSPGKGQLGVNFHTDAGVLTLLLQDDQPGLEVFHEEQWYLVEPRADALVINIGDIVQVWSNDRYRAALHRVVLNSGVSRYSAPYFLNPNYQTDYAPLATMIDAGNPAHYRPINWGEFRALRADGDYADYGDEVQISHYAI